jgi:hypothetical protein
MGFVYQTPETVGGTVLIIERIESQNYVAGVSGWTIEADGDAEFNDLVARGSGIFGPNPGQHVDINETYPGAIGLFSGQPTEVTPGVIGPNFSLPDPDELRVTVAAPQHVATSHVAEIYVSTNAFNQSQIVLNAEFISALGVISYEGWNNIPLAGTWVDFAGARANYFMDPTGRVQLRGQVASGAGVTIGTLPVGRRPTQSMEWVMRAQGGVTLCAVQVTNAGAINVTANAATAQASGIRLDSISFPTQ